MIPYKPHSVTVSKPAASTGELPEQQQAGTCRCDVQPLTATSAYERFGVETMRPHALFADLKERNLFEVAGKVAWGSREFEIKGVKIWDSGLPTDHVEILLEEI